MKAWREVEAHPELHIPSPNEFIPKNFDLKSNADTVCMSLCACVRACVCSLTFVYLF